jgi:hypothetical protein
MSGVNVLVLAGRLLAISPHAEAQEATQEELNHTFILDFSGISRQEIYDRTMKWITNNVRSPGAVIQSEDPETGTIIANGMTTMTADGDSVSVSLLFRMSVNVREGKERVRFLDLQISRTPGGSGDQIPGEGVWHRGAQKRFMLIAKNLSEYVKMKAEP